MARVTIAVDGPKAASIFGRSFTATWDVCPARTPVALTSENIAALSTFVDQLRHGRIDPAVLRHVAPVIATLLGTDAVDKPVFADRIELAADDTAVLTEVPWETAAVEAGDLPQEPDALFGRLLAHLPVCRLVTSQSQPLNIGIHRPRLLLCTSNPPVIDTGRIDVVGMRTICEQVVALHPVFHVQTVRATSWQATMPLLTNFQPNIAIIVGHGESDARGESPTLAFQRPGDSGGEERVPMAEVAKALTAAKSCGLVAMMACDLVRERGYSGACELVRQGVDEVLAMQGSVRQGVVKRVFETFLAQILAGATLPVAAAEARASARSDTHAVLPAAFRSSRRNAEPNNLSVLSSMYGSALKSLAARVAIAPGIPRDVETQVEDLVKSGGARAVNGGPGNGTSTVLRAAIAAVLSENKNRPIIYFDCDLRVPGQTVESWMTKQVIDIASAHPILLPKTSPTSPPWSGGMEFARWLRDANLSVVVDNLPYDLSDEEQFATELLTIYSGAEPTLVLGGDGGWLGSVPASNQVSIDSLTLVETQAYVAKFMPGEDPAALFNTTGGTLLLLDLERRMTSESRRQSGGGHTATTCWAAMSIVWRPIFPRRRVSPHYGFRSSNRRSMLGWLKNSWCRICLARSMNSSTWVSPCRSSIKMCAGFQFLRARLRLFWIAPRPMPGLARRRC